jgi:hypothetical protein
MGDSKNLNTRKALALAFLAYEGGDHVLAKEQMNQRLSQYERWIGKFTTVWGPAYHETRQPLIHRLRKKHSIDSMAFIVQDQNNPTEYYLAIRGTNPRNLSEWIFQDFWVGATVPWSIIPFEGLIPPQQPFAGIPAISFGASTAFTLLIRHLKDSSNGKDIEKFLRDEAKQTHAAQPGQKITIYLAGHSLGGAMASTLALYLNQNWTDSVLKPDLFSFNYAGPTVGNQEFASLSKQILADNSRRYANHLDVATRVWNQASMEKLPVLYNEQKIPMPHLLLKVLYDIAIPAIHDKKYIHIEQYQEIHSKIVPDLDHYVAQMVYQHLIPYIAEFIRLCPDSNQAGLLDLIESWEVFKLFKESKPLARFKHKNLQYFLDLLN